MAGTLSAPEAKPVVLPAKPGASSHSSLSISKGGVTTSSSATVTGGGKVSSTQSSTVNGITTTVRTVMTANGTETETEYSAATPEAQRHLAYNLHHGKEGFPKDIALATFWYEKAAEGGEAIAMNNLGLILQDTGEPENVKRGYELIAQAAELCPNDSAICFNLGKCYYDDKGVAQDYAKAVEWYRKAAEQGNAAAQNNLGDCHYFGNGVAQDYAQAAEWYRKAADQGSLVAQENLGWCYVNGPEGFRDNETAVSWFR